MPNERAGVVKRPSRPAFVNDLGEVSERARPNDPGGVNEVGGVPERTRAGVPERPRVYPNDLEDAAERVVVTPSDTDGPHEGIKPLYVMLYYNFNNYEGFKERFGVRTCGNGEKSRKNKILLSYVKQPSLLRACRESGNYSELNLENMTQLWSTLKCKISNYTFSTASKGTLGCPTFWLENFYLGCKRYKLDEFEGICQDGDSTRIRCIIVAEGKVKKVKPGKFFGACLDDMNFTLPEPVRRWMEEEFTRTWEVYASALVPPTTTLHVDDNFSDIYDSDECKGDFGSCMVDDDQWSFYRDAVDASAAYLRNDKDGKIVARCILFNKVRDERTGECLRLAERQYSTDGDETLKRMLVDALIKGGHIDGYKKVGVGCHDNRAYVGVDGSDWSGRRFSIECDLDDEDVMSYQDSFVYYDMDGRRAYNYDEDNTTECLNDTSTYFHAGYDDFNERYTTQELYEVYAHGRWMNTDYDTREDYFTEINGTYYLTEECECCPECGEYFYVGENCDDHYSELTNEVYCCNSCLEEAEMRYRREHLMYSDYDCEEYDEEGHVTVWKRWEYYGNGRYYDQTISFKSLQAMIDREEVILCNDVWYEVPYTKEKAWNVNWWGEVYCARVRVYNN